MFVWSVCFVWLLCIGLVRWFGRDCCFVGLGVIVAVWVYCFSVGVFTGGYY